MSNQTTNAMTTTETTSPCNELEMHRFEIYCRWYICGETGKDYLREGEGDEIHIYGQASELVSVMHQPIYIAYQNETSGEMEEVFKLVGPRHFIPMPASKIQARTAKGLLLNDDGLTFTDYADLDCEDKQ